MDAMENLLTRRSVRKYKPDMVPKEVLEQIVRAGTYAPTGMNRQSPIILAVTNPDLRDRLSRVDARLDAASLDLENATAAIYEALSQTEDDLRALGVEMSEFRHAPDAPPKAPASPAPPAARQKATAQAVQRPAQSSRSKGTQRAKPQRLRRTGRMPVSQELLDALDRLEDQ